MVKELEVGDSAPRFALPTDGGGRTSLADLMGKAVVLYFYPKDGIGNCPPVLATTSRCPLNHLIPVRLITDACPISMADGLDSFGIVNEETPSFNASLDDFVVGVPDQGAELIFA